MAIGDTRITGGASATPGSFTGLASAPGNQIFTSRGAALGGLGQSIQEGLDVVRKERERLMLHDATKKFYQMRANLGKSLLEVEQNAAADGTGLADAAMQTFKEQRDEFYQSIDASVRRQFDERLLQLGGQLEIDYVKAELGLRSEAALADIREISNEFASQAYLDPSNTEPYIERLREQVAVSPLSAQEKREVLREGEEMILVHSTMAKLAEPLQWKTVGAGSAEFGALRDQVIKMESANNPNARGPYRCVGGLCGHAIGLMQVWTPTARDIAKELGDESFPHGGSDEEVEAFLFNPENNVRYGSHYLRKMLNKYGGDVELALIAYNGGPGRANNFINAGRDYEAIPEETRNYAKKGLRELGVGSSVGPMPMPVAVDDREIMGLTASMDLKQQLLRMKESAQNEQQSAATTQLGLMAEDAAVRVMQGEDPAEARAQLFAMIDTTITDQAVAARLKQSSNEMFAEAVELSTTSDGGRVVTPEERQRRLAAGGPMSYAGEKKALKLQIEAADRARREREAQYSNYVKQRVEAVQAALRSGAPEGMELARDLVREGLINYNDDTYAELRSTYDKHNSERVAIEKVNMATASGSRLLLTDKANRDAIELSLASPAAALTDNDQMEVRLGAVEAIKRNFRVHGYMPQVVENSLNRLLARGNTEDMQLATRLVNELEVANPGSFRKWTLDTDEGKRLYSRAQVFGKLVEFGVNAEQLAFIMSEGSSAEAARTLSSRMDVVEKELGQVDYDSVANEVENVTRFFTGIPYGPGVRFQIKEDYEDLYRRVRPYFSDKDDARDTVISMMQGRYGIFKGKFMKRPPDRMHTEFERGELDPDTFVEKEFPIADREDWQVSTFRHHSAYARANPAEGPVYTIMYRASRERAEAMLEAAETDQERLIAENALMQLKQPDGTLADSGMVIQDGFQFDMSDENIAAVTAEAREERRQARIEAEEYRRNRNPFFEWD